MLTQTLYYINYPFDLLWWSIVFGPFKLFKLVWNKLPGKILKSILGTLIFAALVVGIIFFTMYVWPTWGWGA